MLTASNISKSFRGTMIIDGLSMTVHPGSITALLGPTGVGKTTLIRALGMVDPPDTGSIVLDGVAIPFSNGVATNPVPWPRLGVVFQDLFLWPHLTNRANILLPLRLNRVKDPEARLDAITRELDLVSFLDRFPNEVSRGQRQAVAIARALVLDPKYILMDEVTASLDMVRAVRLAEVLRVRARDGAGVLVVTHQLSFARSQADRVAFLHDGRIVEEGPPELLDSPQSEALTSFISLVNRVA